MTGPLYCGVDAGASATKMVLIDRERRVASSFVRRSGLDFRSSAAECREAVLREAGAAPGDVARCVATGYGREALDFPGARMTEITCHARAAYFHFPRAIIVADIGAQDSKVMHLDAGGRRQSFRMNRKCAAGTGAFLDEMALQLGVPLDRMNELALASKTPATLGSYCTVFTKTEVLALARRGVPVADIARGVYDSVAKRLLEMDALEGEVVMTGGVAAHNSVVATLLEERIGRTVAVAPMAQFAGAFGAALLALEGSDEEITGGYGR